MTEKFHFILYILVWLYANIKLRMAKMNFSSYILILTFSLLSQGISLSASKSIRNLEDDMVFKTLRLGKAFQKEDTAEKSIVVPSLEQYKNDESSFMNDEENKNSKVSVWLVLYFNGNLNDLYESFESKVDTFISRREQNKEVRLGKKANWIL